MSASLRYQCLTCQKAFPSPRALYSHCQSKRHKLMAASPIYISPTSLNQCPTCYKGFSSRSSLASHRKAKQHGSGVTMNVPVPASPISASPTSHNQCPTCNKSFSNPASLASHCSSKRHGPGIAMDVYCQSCKRGFKSLSGLESHMNALGHFTLHSSLVAGASTSVNDVGRDSVEPTLNPSTYLDGSGDDAGPVENSAFPSASKLANPDSYVGIPGAVSDSAQWAPLHPTRDLNCAICHASFASPSGVASHIESGCHAITRHQVTAAVYAMNIVPNITTKRITGPPSPPTTIKTYVATEASFNGTGYKCHLCRKKKTPFKTLNSLNTHLNSAAHDCRNFKCPKCQKKFKLISGFVAHLEKGGCGLAKVPEITGYFQNLSAQFSGLLTL